MDDGSKQCLDQSDWANLSKTQKKRIRDKKGKNINKGINSQLRANVESKNDINIEKPKLLPDQKDINIVNPFSD